jgi:SulP family sulfate permease
VSLDTGPDSPHRIRGDSLNHEAARRFAPFRPRLLDALRGYSLPAFQKDLGAGLTVGIVALPLAMAFAIASGLPPQAGLWTAILAGAIVALFGGSNVQIAGPAGAFIVIVLGIVERHGVANLLIATACAGVLLFLLGLLRMGNLVRLVPVSIVVGFTNGIAVLIALSQLRDWLGLQVPRMPADFFSQVGVLAAHLPSFNPSAFALGALTVAGLWLWPRVWAARSPLPPVLGQPLASRIAPVGARIPGPVVALVSLSYAAWALGLPVETIGSRFGQIPQGLPAWQPPAFSWESAKQLVNPIVTLTLLGAIESLLCARVADQASGLRRHDPNQELMAQGMANLVTPFFGGMPATGTIARTVTNVRAGATTPVAALVHAAVLAVIVLALAPWALHVPLAVLAGILLFTAWNMGEWREFARLRGQSGPYRILMLSTFGLTVVFDLTVALQVGAILACVFFVRSMGLQFRVEIDPRPDAAAPGTLGLRLTGPLFFGSVARMDPALRQLEKAAGVQRVQVDAERLLYLDTTGCEALVEIDRLLRARGGRLSVHAARGQPLAALTRAGLLQDDSPGVNESQVV